MLETGQILISGAFFVDMYVAPERKCLLILSILFLLVKGSFLPSDSYLYLNILCSGHFSKIS
jgi:hypothetical protein